MLNQTNKIGSLNDIKTQKQKQSLGGPETGYLGQNKQSLFTAHKMQPHFELKWLRLSSASFLPLNLNIQTHPVVPTFDPHTGKCPKSTRYSGCLIYLHPAQSPTFQIF